MGKNILIVSASPRRHGNSDTLCDEFMRGAAEAGHRAEKIFLRDRAIDYGMGCGACNRTHKCVQRDDMEEILDKMVAADVLVLATPVYFYTMDAQLKTLIDRTVPRYTEMWDKEVYFLITAADTDTPAWAGQAAANLAACGMAPAGVQSDTLTRADAAELLLRARGVLQQL